MRDDPLLRNRPMAVGGSSDHRSVISTCNYEARAYGVHSAMSTVLAKKRCPALIVVPHNMNKYREAAEKIRDIFDEYSELVETISLDEAFIDVTGSTRCGGSATLIAKEIMLRVYQAVGITISAGVATNKFLAKVGSDWNKPNGICVIPPEKVTEFVAQLPVGKIWGVGKVTLEKLQRLGIYTCDDLQCYTQIELVNHFGSFGLRLYDLSRGKDERPVITVRRRKSLSVEHTYASDLLDINECIGHLPDLFTKLDARLEPLKGSYSIGKQFVKLKFSNFQVTTMECGSIGSPKITLYNDLFYRSLERGNGLSVRLLGLGVRFTEPLNEGEQLSLF